MSRKNYEAIAAAFQEARKANPTDNDAGFNDGIDEAISCVAHALKQDNAAFDTDRFIRACQPGANVKARS